MTPSRLARLTAIAAFSLAAACAGDPAATTTPVDAGPLFAKPAPLPSMQFLFPASGYGLLGDGLPYSDGVCGVTAVMNSDGLGVNADVGTLDPSCGRQPVTLILQVRHLGVDANGTDIDDTGAPPIVSQVGTMGFRAGANGLTEIKNSAQAEIQGVEADLTWAATDRFTVSGGVAFIDSELTEHYCGFVDATGKPETRNPCPDPGDIDDDPSTTEFTPEAFKGTELPVTPEFKANLTLRQTFPLGSFEGHWRASYVYKGESRADLRDVANTILGDQPSYDIVDFSAGIERGSYSIELFVNNAFDERALLYRYVQCAEEVCGAQPYLLTTPPRTIGLKFSQKF